MNAPQAKQVRSPGMEAAIAQVRGLIGKTPPSTLAVMYRQIAQVTLDAAQRDSDKKHWTEMVALLNMSTDIEVAEHFRANIDKTIEVAPPKMAKDFLAMVISGIIEVSRRS